MNICVYTNVIVNIYNKLAKLSTTGFYLTKLDEIGYQVCFSSWRDVYETIRDSFVLRKNTRIAISRKQHFRSPKRKNENTLQYKVPPKTWENSPQKPLLATRKWFFGHCYVQNVRFLKKPQSYDFFETCSKFP